MDAFRPSSIHAAALLVAGLASTLAAGLLITRLRSQRLGRVAAWTLVVAATIFAERMTAAEEPGLRMLALIGFVLYAMKAVVGVESAAGRSPMLTPIQWLAFAALWPGMRPASFKTFPSSPRPGAVRLAARGLLHVVIGSGIILLGRIAWSTTRSELMAAALLLPGLSLVLHFGLLNVLAGTWRAAGADAEPLFRAPHRSTSLREFWGRRWNLAFIEMTAVGIYRPLTSIAGRRGGTVCAFLASGALHELAISVPVRAGYGLPLAYFALHGAAVLVEGAFTARGAKVKGKPWMGRAWTIAWLVLPLPILFHSPFLRGVVWPLVGMRD